MRGEGVGEGAGKLRKEGWGYKRHRGYCAGVHEVTEDMESQADKVVRVYLFRVVGIRADQGAVPGVNHGQHLGIHCSNNNKVQGVNERNHRNIKPNNVTEGHGPNTHVRGSISWGNRLTAFILKLQNPHRA